MSENARSGRAPMRGLILILGLLLVAGLGAVMVAAQARAQGTPPEELTEEELLSRITAAPENAPDFSATATVEQTLVPEGLLGASQGNGAGDSGPRSARIWYGGPDKLRTELQSENGDQIFVKNGSEVRAYDGATNTLRTGEKPEPEGQPEEAASPEKIDEVLAEISPTSDLRTGPPVEFAGRWAYPLTLEPKDKSQTLVERAEALVDAEAFVPLSFELYAEDTPEPVVRYEASDFEVGNVPDERFRLETPPGAEVVPMEEQNGSEERDERGGEDR
jgi:outer membrane lipoprotein-sorting protein